MFMPQTHHKQAALGPEIYKHMEGSFLVGGDFNSVCDPLWDGSKAPLSNE